MSGIIYGKFSTKCLNLYSIAYISTFNSRYIHGSFHSRKFHRNGVFPKRRQSYFNTIYVYACGLPLTLVIIACILDSIRSCSSYKYCVQPGLGTDSFFLKGRTVRFCFHLTYHFSNITSNFQFQKRHGFQKLFSSICHFVQCS